jgi:molecular chaperone GrpE (heat shock protein)
MAPRTKTQKQVRVSPSRLLAEARATIEAQALQISAQSIANAEQAEEKKQLAGDLAEVRRRLDSKQQEAEAFQRTAERSNQALKEAASAMLEMTTIAVDLKSEGEESDRDVLFLVRQLRKVAES